MSRNSHAHAELHEAESGARLVATDGRALAQRSTALSADACAGVARVVVKQVFANPYDEPLHVTYSLPLPDGAAVSGFTFRVGDRLIAGEVDRVQAARERFEEALLEGRSAALLEQDRSTLFTQEIGNIPPRAEIVAEISVDQKLAWRDEGAWEWRFPTVVAPRYLGAPGRVPDARRIDPDVAGAPLSARLSLALTVRDALVEGARPESPSHALAVSRERRAVAVALAEREGVRLDRDVVVRWRVAAPSIGLSLDVARPAAERAVAASAYGLLTLVPLAGEPSAVPRDLIVLIDTSGSMDGEPLGQARRVVSALVSSLGEDDRLELIEFSTEARRWKRHPTAATAEARRDALRWISKLEAGGGTEMVSGILEALGGLRPDAQRQVVLVSDGLIGFESEVVAKILEKLPRGSRLHTLGVGSAVNRSLTGPAARAGHGVEVVVGLGEDPERAARELTARLRAPVVVDLAIEGSAVRRVAPERIPDLFAGSPARLALELAPEGGEIVVRGRTAEGELHDRLRVEPVAPAAGSAALPCLYARERVEDLEMHRAAGKRADEIDAEIERLGLDFQVATRLTAWIAVSEEVMVDPRAPSRRVRMPQELPHGMSVAGLGLRGAAAMPALAGALVGAYAMAPAPQMEVTRTLAQALPAMGAPKKRAGVKSMRGALGRVFQKREGEAEGEEVARFEPAPVLRARQVRLGEGEVVLEIEVEGAPLSWDPDEAIELAYEDGTVAAARIDLGRSTRVGTIEAGQVARLVVALAAPAPARLRRLMMRSGGGALVIEVD